MKDLNMSCMQASISRISKLQVICLPPAEGASGSTHNNTQHITLCDYLFNKNEGKIKKCVKK